MEKTDLKTLIYLGHSDATQKTASRFDGAGEIVMEVSSALCHRRQSDWARALKPEPASDGCVMAGTKQFIKQLIIAGVAVWMMVGANQAWASSCGSELFGEFAIKASTNKVLEIGAGVPIMQVQTSRLSKSRLLASSYLGLLGYEFRLGYQHDVGFSPPCAQPYNGATTWVVGAGNYFDFSPWLRGDYYMVGFRYANWAVFEFNVLASHKNDGSLKPSASVSIGVGF